MKNTVEKTAEQEPSQEEKIIQRLKAQYGKVYQLKVPTDDDGGIAVGYLKAPTRQILASALAFAESDPFKSNEIILNSCWIEGDERILKDDEINFSAINSLQGIVNVRRGEIKKL